MAEEKALMGSSTGIVSDFVLSGHPSLRFCVRVRFCLLEKIRSGEDCWVRQSETIAAAATVRAISKHNTDTKGIHFTASTMTRIVALQDGFQNAKT